MTDRDPPTLYTEAAIASMEADKRAFPKPRRRPIRDALWHLARLSEVRKRRRESDGLPEPPEAA